MQIGFGFLLEKFLVAGNLYGRHIGLCVDDGAVIFCVQLFIESKTTTTNATNAIMPIVNFTNQYLSENDKGLISFLLN